MSDTHRQQSVILVQIVLGSQKDVERALSMLRDDLEGDPNIPDESPTPGVIGYCVSHQSTSMEVERPCVITQVPHEVWLDLLYKE